MLLNEKSSAPAGCLALTPTGELVLESGPTDLLEAFSRGGARGLCGLAAAGAIVDSLGAEFSFWRGFANSCLAALAHMPEAGDGTFPAAVPMPAGLAAELTLKIPAMRGGEYVAPEVFEELWKALVEHARVESKGRGGLRAWLAGINPALHLLGKVTFHLAENKRSPETPFAFMATYTHRLGVGEKPVHLPLARALQEYAGSKNQAALQSLLEPVRQAAEASEWTRGMLESRRVFQPQAWTPAQAHAFLREVPVLENAGITTRIPNWWKNGRASRPVVSVRLGDEKPGGVGLESLMKFSIHATLDGEPLSSAEWEELRRAGNGLVSLRGQWVEVDRDKLDQVLEHWKEASARAGEGISFLESMRLLAGFRAGSKEESGPEDAAREWSEVTAGGALREVLESLSQPDRAAAFDPGEGLAASLRPYQATGVRWLWLLQKLGLGACLADDMGLGKTIQVIALLNRLRRESADGGTSLLVAPASLLSNWSGEILKFAPDLRAVVLHPSANPVESFRDAVSGEKLLAGRDLAITTYGQAVRLEWLKSHPWRLLVLDEAQAIKNPGSKQTRAVKAIPARARIALSGTPVENRLGDLWSLYDFLNPGLLGSSADFANAMKRIQSAPAPDYAPLRRLVSPYLLRRLKTDRRIIADLPDKTELDAWCPLAKKQAVLYEKSVAELAEKLEASEGGIQRRGLVLAFLMRFKQICNHPAHWLGGEWDGDSSGKLQRLAALTEEIASRQEKVLVFTQFREATEPLAEHLQSVFGRPGLVLHGGVAVGKRRALVEEFQRADGPPFFVLSLKAGGTGLTLTAASHVIHFDRWWNPAIENQATDRAFRIGQKRNVLVHKFTCRGTIEERIHDLINSKKALAESVLGAEAGAENLLTEMSNQELLDFVRLDLKTALAE